MSNEFNIKISTPQINHLFHNIRKLDGAKTLLAKKLRITPVTLDDYLRQGQSYIEAFDSELSEIYEIDIDAIDEELEERKSDFIEEFIEKEGVSGGISDRNKNAFIVYFYDRKEKIKEKQIFDYQKQIIDNIKFSENKDEDFKIRILIMFKLIFDRGQMSIDEELIYLKGRYGKTSSKNVGVVINDLERRNREDFEKPKEEPQKQITVNQMFNNFTQIAVEQDKALGLIRDEGIIDLLPEMKQGNEIIEELNKE